MMQSGMGQVKAQSYATASSFKLQRWAGEQGHPRRSNAPLGEEPTNMPGSEKDGKFGERQAPEPKVL